MTVPTTSTAAIHWPLPAIQSKPVAAPKSETTSSIGIAALAPTLRPQIAIVFNSLTRTAESSLTSGPGLATL